MGKRDAIKLQEYQLVFTVSKQMLEDFEDMWDDEPWLTWDEDEEEFVE